MGSLDRRRAVRQIAREAAQELQERYGSNSAPATRGRSLPYHNATHGIEVHHFAVRAGAREAASGALPASLLPALRVAAIFHDYAQGLGRGNDERLSADAAAAALGHDRYRGLFDDTDVRAVRLAILATEPDLSVPGRIGQLVTVTGDDGLDAVQRVLADADLASLGLPRGLHRALTLLVELQASAGVIADPAGPEDVARADIPAEVLEGFLGVQLTLYRTHRFQLPAVRAELAAGLARNADFAEELLRAVGTGAGFPEIFQRAARAAEPAGALGRAVGRHCAGGGVPT